MKRALFSDPLTIASCVVSFFLLSVLYSSARFWWQIPITALSPVWLPILLLIGVLQCVRLCLKRANQIGASATLLAITGSFYCLAVPVVPLLHSQPSSFGATTTPYSLAVVEYQHERAFPVVTSDFVVVLGGELPPKHLPEYRFRRIYEGNDVHFSVASKLLSESDSIESFGDGVLPEGALRFILPNGESLWLGLIELWERSDRDAFEMNRVTLRRIGTFYRNIRAPGIVVVDLKTPIFTKYYGLLTRYGHLRNVWGNLLYASGGVQELLRFCYEGRHILMNPRIEIGAVQYVPSDGKHMAVSYAQFGVRNFNSELTNRVDDEDAR